MFDSFNILKALNNPENIMSDDALDTLRRELDTDDVYAEVPALIQSGLRVLFLRTMEIDGDDYETVEHLIFDRDRLASVSPDAMRDEVIRASRIGLPEIDDGQKIDEKTMMQMLLLMELFRLSDPQQNYDPKKPVSDKRLAIQSAIDKMIPDESILVLACREENNVASIQSGFLLCQTLVLVDGVPM